MKNIVILAGGMNTRFEEMSVFPKVLLPLSSTEGSVLSHDCNIFAYDNIYLVINEKYYDMVSDYISNNNLNVTLVKSVNNNGSMNTIKSVLDELPKNDLLFVWSDLILSKASGDYLHTINVANDDCVIFTHFGKYRCQITPLRNVANDVEYGNVPGIYWIKDTSMFDDYELDSKANYDLFDFLTLSDNYTIIPTDTSISILEFKDKKTYLDYYLDENRLNPEVTRFFNEITVKDGKLTKKCVNENYDHLIKTECDWYEKAKSLGLDSIPTIYELDKENNKIVMEYLDGSSTLASRLISIKDNNDLVANFLNSYMNVLDKMHMSDKKEISKNDWKDDAFKEFYTKVIDRCQRISHMIVGYDNDELLNIIGYAFDLIMTNVKVDSYEFIHGDLNGSNVLVTKDGQLKFIDPRGYFGMTKMYGPSVYDFAKVLYALYGYDRFNKGAYVFFSKDHYMEPEKIIDDMNIVPVRINNRMNRIIVGIIFVALAQYISQDIFKVNIAYRYGLKILKGEIYR